MRFVKSVPFLILSALIAIGFGCGKKDDGIPSPYTAPNQLNPIGNCPQITGGTFLSQYPFQGSLTPIQNYNYNWNTQLSSIILSPSITTTVGYTYQSSKVIASGQISLAELSSLYQNSTIPAACIASPSGAQTGQGAGSFFNGQVSSLVLTGSISVPLYSPFSWQGYPTGAPGTNQTLGQQLIQVIVGSTCATSFVPSYGNNPGRIRGCISVRMGTQANSQVLNYQSQ